jgi:hypothetical protein
MKFSRPPIPVDVEKEISEYYEKPVPKSEFVLRLEHQLRIRYGVKEHKKMLEMKKKKMILTIGFASIAALLIFIFVSTDMAKAMKRVLGYIPGIGMVDTSGTLRVLPEPVTQIRDGVTVTVVQVVADEERTVIVYKAEGLTIEAANSNGEQLAPVSLPLLYLADGTALGEIHAGGYDGITEPLVNNIVPVGGWPNYVQRLVFPPLNLESDELKLVIPLLQNMPLGTAPANWEIPLQLQPAPPNYEVNIYTEITSSQVDVTRADVTPTQNADMDSLANTSQVNGFTFSLDTVIELPDGFVFTGRFFWDDTVFPAGSDIYLYVQDLIILSDGGGQAIPIEAVNLGDAPEGVNERVWSVRTNTKNFQSPLVLSIPSIEAMYVPPRVEFEFDLGANPQIGQIWDINQEISIDGQVVRITSIELVDNQDAICLVFAGENAAGIVIHDRASEWPDALCSSNGSHSPSMFIGPVVYQSIPSGVHRFSVGVRTYYISQGPWQVLWNPPMALGPTPAPTSTPILESGACLTYEKWKQLMSQGAQPAQDLEGKLWSTVYPNDGTSPVFYANNPGGTNPERFNVDGFMGAAKVSVSNNGTHLAYTSNESIQVADLLTGKKITIGGGVTDFSWSPDGMQILYAANVSGLYVVKFDGSGQQQLNIGSSDLTSAIGWLSDNQTVIYGVLGGDGTSLKSFDLQSGKTVDLFTINNTSVPGKLLPYRYEMSPDGQWIIFSENPFGQSIPNLYVSRIDGSERRLVVDSDLWNPPIWDPSGQWLFLNQAVVDGDLAHRIVPMAGVKYTVVNIPVLVNPFTCEIRLLPMNSGLDVMSFVEDWSP